MSNDKHIWEGWHVSDFIKELEPTFDMIMNYNSWQKPFTSKQEIKDWCKDQQPYYKKNIPEVSKYFITKAGIK